MQEARYRVLNRTSTDLICIRLRLEALRQIIADDFDAMPAEQQAQPEGYNTKVQASEIEICLRYIDDALTHVDFAAGL